MKSPESPPDKPVIVDTVVLRYFLLTERFDLLAQVLGSRITASRIVYDPGDLDRDIVHGEMAISIRVQNGRSADFKPSREEREQAKMFAERLSAIHDYCRSGLISVVDMSLRERSIYSRLGSEDNIGEYDIAFPLGGGEAASIAIAVERGWTLATDDNDALKALHRLRPDHPCLRVRRILIDAADLGFITPTEANGIHAEMRSCGFWDNTSPYECYE